MPVKGLLVGVIIFRQQRLSFSLFYFACIATNTNLLLPFCSVFYSWFATYNFLSEKIPKQDTQLKELGRRAVLGFCASAVSDTCSNSIRVMKVYKQSHPEQLTYVQVFRNVIAESGIQGLMFRGLETKILANGMQGILFSILWKQFEEILFPKNK